MNKNHFMYSWLMNQMFVVLFSHLFILCLHRAFPWKPTAQCKCVQVCSILNYNLYIIKNVCDI